MPARRTRGRKVHYAQLTSLFGFTVHVAPLRLVPAALVGVAVIVLVFSPIPVGAGSSVRASLEGAGPSVRTEAAPTSRTFSGSDVPAASTPDAATLAAPGQSPSAISLSWSDATPDGDEFTNYTVETASASSDWKLAAVATITDDATTTYVQTGLSPATNYDWQVVENYESCVILGIGCTAESVSSNLLNLTQPSVAFLNYTDLTSTSATLLWTNNATYGGQISFDEYQVYESKDGAGAVSVQTITSESATSYGATLSAGDSYTFYVETEDCAPSCSGTGLSTTQSNLITLGPPETLSVTVTAERSVIDLGQSDLFTCVPSGGESPFSYSWSLGGGSYVSGNASESFVLSETPTESVQCQVVDSEPTSESSGTSVVVNPPLVVVASVNRTAADVGQTATFVCYAEGGTTPYALSWSFGDSDTSPLGNVTHIYASAASYAPFCIVSDGTGATLAPAFGLIVSPALSATATAESTAAAPGTALSFTAHPVDGSGTYTAYNWTFSDGGTAQGSQVSHAFSRTGSQTATLIVTDSNGATASAMATVAVSYVTALATGPTSATVGTSVSFSAVASGGAGSPYNYTWTFGTGAIAYGAEVSHTFSTKGTFSPQLTVKDALGAVNVTTLAAVHVSAAPPPLSGFATWLILGIGVAVALVLAAVVLARRRSEEAKALAAGSAYVPPTNPSRTIRGRKVCPFCGATNLPVRTTCAQCGKQLPRGSS